MTTDTSERGLERLICTALTGSPCDPGGADAGAADAVHEQPATYGAGWICGSPDDYDREYCVDLAQLAAFLGETQSDAAESLALDEDGPTRRKFLARLQGEITKRGTIDVLRHGLKHGPHHLDLFYGTPSPGNPKAAERYGQNRFSVTRQLRYSRDETQLALDLALFINGLPVATFELKNSLTKQTVADAVQQYQRDRDSREKLFEFGRCVAHFAVDEHEVRFCTHLKGKASWFLPFNRGWNDGAGNPPNPDGLKTDYLWKRVLTKDGLADILENYAQVVETKDEKTGRRRAVQIWPRYHQLDVVRRLLADVAERGAGHVGQEPADHIELVVSRPDLHRPPAAGLLVLGLHHLGVVLEDIGEAVLSEDALPQVVGLEAVRVGRVARAVVPAPVEGQEPGGLALEVRAEAHLVLIHGEVGHAAPKLEELLARVAVALVLLDGVGDGLLGQAVLQLEGSHR